jgi:hypothetical protein
MNRMGGREAGPGRGATCGDIDRGIHAAGLTPRGGFHPRPEDGVPELGPGRPARTLVLVGNAGGAMWRAFSTARDTATDRLDDWTREALEALAGRFGATVHFPFSRPFLPFQRWAQRAEPCHVSPLGILVHPDYGLWHGYRGALAFSGRLELPPPDARPHPCETCDGEPCLRTCPVSAFGPEGYDVAACFRHLATRASRDCMDRGCRARRACPVGRAYRYEPAQARFHMHSFFRRRLRKTAP